MKCDYCNKTVPETDEPHVVRIGHLIFCSEWHADLYEENRMPDAERLLQFQELRGEVQLERTRKAAGWRVS